VDAQARKVHTRGGSFDYDWLVVATGARLKPDEVEGLAAALDGIDRQLPVPKPLNNVNVYHLTAQERVNHEIVELPGSLKEAVAELKKDEVLKAALGPVIYEAFTRVKEAEWDEYRTHVTDWEVERYLEVA